MLLNRLFSDEFGPAVYEQVGEGMKSGYSPDVR
jgi:hypothetical protein